MPASIKLKLMLGAAVVAMTLVVIVTNPGPEKTHSVVAQFIGVPADLR